MDKKLKEDFCALVCKFILAVILASCIFILGKLDAYKDVIEQNIDMSENTTENI